MELCSIILTFEEVAYSISLSLQNIFIPKRCSPSHFWVLRTLPNLSQWRGSHSWQKLRPSVQKLNLPCAVKSMCITIVVFIVFLWFEKSLDHISRYQTSYTHKTPCCIQYFNSENVLETTVVILFCFRESPGATALKREGLLSTIRYGVTCFSFSIQCPI